MSVAAGENSMRILRDGSMSLVLEVMERKQSSPIVLIQAATLDF